MKLPLAVLLLAVGALTGFMLGSFVYLGSIVFTGVGLVLALYYMYAVYVTTPDIVYNLTYRAKHGRRGG